MDRKKYEFTGETRALSSTTILHRIRAVIDIPSAGVNAGDIGGWIESDSNLSHRGNAWVDGNAWVLAATSLLLRQTAIRGDGLC